VIGKGTPVPIALLLALCMGMFLPVSSIYGEGEAPPSDLFLQTVPLQITTSTFIELADWCKRLGLSTEGTRKDLEERLYAYYGISPAKPEGQEKEKETLVQIKSASSTEYYSLPEFEEEYVRLDGGVHLVMEDTKKGTTYTLFADSVLYNRSKKLLSAYGNVRYEIKSQGKEEKFTGSNILINLDTWEGYFLQGQSIRERTISGEPLTFRLRGEFISRSTSDFVLMEGASITSSTSLPPNYRLDAGKIWILGPQEWGVKDATLYVGNIPIFYFPFFFYPGDEVVFHPVFGYKSREGTFFQTTTYLVGNRKNEAGSASFLQLSDMGPNDRVKSLHGIFLKDTEEKLPHPDWHVKLLLDAYSRLGVYGGIEGSLPNLVPKLKTFTFSSGLGISRNLYSGTVPGFTGAYTPYWQEKDGTFSTFWNNTYFLGTELPFRYGGELSMEYVQDPLQLRLKFEQYSDPYFKDDFGDRMERIDWSRLLQSVVTVETTPVLKEQLDWFLEGSYSFNTASLTPWITSFRIPRVRTSLNWKSKEIPFAFLKEYERVDPTRRYYYPSVLTLPEMSLELGGTLYRYVSTWAAPPPSTAKGSSPSGGKKPSAELRPPWESSEKKEEPPPEELPDLKAPNPLPNATLTPFPVPITLDLTYTLRPTLTYQNSTYPDLWVYPKDVDYQFSYATLTVQNLFQLITNVRLYDKLIQQQNTLSFSSRYRDVTFWDDSLPANQKRSLELTAYQYRTFSISDAYTFTTYPLLHTELFQNSNVNYSVNAFLFQRSFTALVNEEPLYKDQYLDFSKKTITQHRTQLNLIGNFYPLQPQFQFTYTMPPLDEVFSTIASLGWGPSTTTVSLTQKKIDSQWVNQPLSFQQRLQFSPQVIFNGTYLYDLEEDHPTSFAFSATLWYLQFQFNARYTEPYRYEGPSKGWIKQEKKEFIPSDLSFGLSYRYEPDPLWKNRIRLSTGVNSSFSMNLLRYTESSLSVSYDLVFSIYRFLDLKLSTTSKNTAVYQYFPGLAEGVDRSWRNPLVDLAKSFNFFRPKDRYESFFKLSSIKLEAVHHLDDWNLTISYTGTPELLTLSNGRQEFRWNGILGIFLKWKPIPEVKSEFRYDKTGLTY